MPTRASQPWIPLERVEAFVQVEPGLVILGLVVGAWVVYKLLLGDISDKRHSRLVGLFRNLFWHLLGGGVLFFGFLALQQIAEPPLPVVRLMSYVGVLTLVWGAMVFVKTCRILLFEYLFLGHMREGVPLLLVNLFTLVLSILIAGWIATDIFSVRLAPLLATSAILSIVLGLALQDTLGNLFAGVALQFDKPYSIGDWIEVNATGQKWAGQVLEVSWRATILTGFAEEAITIPNRVIGQAQISNFTINAKPIIRSLVFRIPYGASLRQVDAVLVRAAGSVPRVCRDPGPLTLFGEANEHWISCKLLYFIDDYGQQYAVADRVLKAALSELEREGVRLASERILVEKLVAS